MNTVALPLSLIIEVIAPSRLIAVSSFWSLSSPTICHSLLVNVFGIVILLPHDMIAFA